MNRASPRIARWGGAPGRFPDEFPVADRAAGADHDVRPAWLGQRRTRVGLHLSLDLVDDPLGFLHPAVQEQPAWALRDVAAYQQDPQPDDGSCGEGDPPADVGREERRVEQGQRGDTADRGSHPEAAVDREIDAPSVAAGISSLMAELIAEYSPPMPTPVRNRHRKEVPGHDRERRGDGGHQVDREGEHEEFLAAVAIRQLAEEQRPEAGTGDVECADRPDVSGTHADPAVRLGQLGRHGPHDRDLEAVQHPDGPEADDDPPVKA